MVANGKLYTIVMEKLNFDPRLDTANITVSIKGNHDVVVLGGTVSSLAEKLIAENAVKTIPGIRAIADEIKVEPSTRYKKSDVEIVEAVMSALKWNALVPEEQIKVVIEDGYVTLSGKVEWQHQKHSAWISASNIWGVKSVINNIMVKPSIRIDANKVKEQITKELERNARIDASKVIVEVKGETIILRGELRNLEEMDEALDAAWSIPGVSEVRNQLIIAW